jgi:tetratricopeptide (TPR) repeat protein
VFTTNYDDLIEQAYRSAGKLCQSLYADNPSFNPTDRSRTYLFKIMGCVTARPNETGQMVLTESDMRFAYRRRWTYLESLSDFVKNGCIVFAGYSFDDRLAFDVMEDLLKALGPERMPYSYALLRNLQTNDKWQRKFAALKVLPLECDFQTFANAMGADVATAVVPSERGVTYKLRGHSLTVKESVTRNLEEYFEIPNEQSILEPPGDRDSFFMGKNRSWGAFRSGWDFQRDVFSLPGYVRSVDGTSARGCIRDRVVAELGQYGVERNAVLLVKGMAGVGKSTLLRRIAFEVYSAGIAPVILVKPTRITFDYKQLASFIEALNAELDASIAAGEPSRPLKPLIIIDNAGPMARHLNRLKNYLASRGRSALILAAERTGEWNTFWTAFPFSLPATNVYQLEETLSGAEKKRIVEHLHRLGYLATPGDFWDEIIKRTCGDSFFATIYTLVHPSRKPLSEIVRAQYLSLSVDAQRAFRYVCLFHQFDTPITQDLLVRALGVSYDSFYRYILGEDSEKVIFEETSGGFLSYRSHHRIVAKITADTFFGDAEMQTELLVEILSHANLANRPERDICEKLLVEHIGPSAKSSRFSPNQQRQIFKAACQKNPARSLVHHWGILECDDHKYAEAVRLLTSALQMPRDEVDSYRGESNQNILTSLGNAYSRWGVETYRTNQRTEAQELLAKAEECFQGARHGDFPNAHAYHAHAHMCLMLAEAAADQDTKLNYLSGALDVISDAQDNLDEDELEPLLELETQVWAMLGDGKEIVQRQEKLRDTFKSARGYSLYGELLRKRSRDFSDTKRAEQLELSLEQAETGLRFFPGDEACLRLKARILKELGRRDQKDFLDTLQKWHAVASTPNVWLLYELGRGSFVGGYFQSAKNAFDELERGASAGLAQRARPRDPMSDTTGKEREFTGKVAGIVAFNVGYIRCDSLRELRYDIPFRPVAAGFTPSVGDLVGFAIEFNYRGPVASKVHKL